MSDDNRERMEREGEPVEGAVRRQVLLGIGAASAAVAAAGTAQAAVVAPADGSILLKGLRIRFVDLTHKLTRAFNFSPSNPRISMEAIDGSGKAVGMKLNRLSLVEHTGTHIDTPRHFTDGGASMGELSIDDLISPLAVLDLREKFTANGNATVEAADIEHWERRHGRLPAGCCVAMWSGFDPLTQMARISSAARQIQAPGFSPEVADLLIRRRSVKGVAVDSMSIDSGDHVPSYPFHKTWLSSGRWGVEGMTNLTAVPPSGAVLIIGAPPIEDATGIPIRAVALF